MKNFVYSLFLLGLPATLHAQTANQTIEFEEIINATVIEENKALLNPFCGGINSTQPNHADLNNDGKNDLTIYDHNTRTLKTFINVGTTGEEKYQYDPKYAKNFPPISNYLKLIDYNCDNVPDLIHKGSAGFHVQTGKYVNNELTFIYYRELYYPGFIGQINAYTQPTDIPIVDDIDGDGDLDFVSWNVPGTLMFFYKNLQVEDNLPCDSIRIQVESECYGGAQQTFNRTHLFNFSCKGGGVAPQNKQRHSGNCMVSLDFNGNGLKDIIGGNISFNDAYLLINGGTQTNTIFTAQDTMFDAGGHELELYSWPAPFYFDIDNDNDKDLVFTPHNDNINSANYNAMAVYENQGSTASPNFVWRNDSAFVQSMVDVGRNSHPTFFDYDKDGKLDLFVGAEGYFNTILKDSRSQIAYYRNTSTIGAVSFDLVTKDFINLSAMNYDGLYPTFGDITGDGIDDLVIGNDSGTIMVYKNTAISNTQTPNFVFQTDSLPGIDVGNYSFPLIYDFNNDGKTDLLIGCEIGTIWLYQDSSITATKDLKRVDSSMGNVHVGSIYEYLAYGVPFIGKVDSSNKDYLLIGTSEGTIERFDDFNNSTNAWTRVDSQMANIQTAYRSAPAIADLDGDQRPELIIGSQNGGLQLFRFAKNLIPSSTVSVGNLDNQVPVQIYPNPANDQLWLKADKKYSTIQSYQLLDITGRLIVEHKKPQSINEGMSLEGLNNGFYFIKISFGENKFALAKFLIQN